MNLFDKAPVVGEGAFVAPSAAVIGSVTLGPKASVFYNSVLRGASPAPAPCPCCLAHFRWAFGCVWGICTAVPGCCCAAGGSVARCCRAGSRAMALLGLLVGTLVLQHTPYPPRASTYRGTNRIVMTAMLHWLTPPPPLPLAPPPQATPAASAWARAATSRTAV